MNQKVVKHLHAKSAVKCSHVFHTYTLCFLHISVCMCLLPQPSVIYPCAICSVLDVLYVCVREFVSLQACSISDDVSFIFLYETKHHFCLDVNLQKEKREYIFNL